MIAGGVTIQKPRKYPARWIATFLSVMSLGQAVRAADLGQTCCADLEARIAELEVSGALRGHRKFVLTVSGLIAQELTYWDDGGEDNAYIHSLASQTSHFKFGGQANIAEGWSAGYLLRIQLLNGYPFLRLNDGRGIDQYSDERNFGLDTHMAYWFVQNKDFGKLTIGRLSSAAKGSAMLTDQSGTQPFDNYSMLSGLPQFIIRSNGDLEPSGLRWAEIAYCHSQSMPLGADCNGVSLEAVRYDTPVLNGLMLSASWGADDFWDVAARYNAEAGGYKVALAAGFSRQIDETGFGPPVTFTKNSDFLQLGAYIQHLQTGLFAHAAYGFEDNHNTLLHNGDTAENNEHFGVKAGVRRAWTPLGATVLYLDYTAYFDALSPTALAIGATESTFTRCGGGIAQEFDEGSMTLYLKYQHYDAEISGAALDPAVSRLEGADFISFGNLITF